MNISQFFDYLITQRSTVIPMICLHPDIVNPTPIINFHLKISKAGARISFELANNKHYVGAMTAGELYGIFDTLLRGSMYEDTEILVEYGHSDEFYNNWYIAK